MNIPHYTEVYHTCDHACYDHKIKTSYLLDTSKTTSIVDARGELRYIIKLESELIDTNIENNQQIPGYKILAMRLNVNDTVEVATDDNSENATIENYIILDVYPDNGYEFDYIKSQKMFDKFVKKYQALVDAESCDYSDMSVYHERINYKTTYPKCCGTCEWCHKSLNHNHCKSSKHHAFECHNPKNQQVFSYMTDCPDIKTKHKCDHKYNKSAWNHLPWQKKCDDQSIKRGYNIPLNTIFPFVELFGVCDNYKLKKSK